MTSPDSDRISDLSDSEQAYIARWVALKHPEIAKEGLEALGEYRRDHPDRALLFLGADGGK